MADDYIRNENKVDKQMKLKKETIVFLFVLRARKCTPTRPLFIVTEKLFVVSRWHVRNTASGRALLRSARTGFRNSRPTRFTVKKGLFRISHVPINC